MDAIVNTKQRLSEEKGITFIVNAAIPKKCCVREIDMSNILGNLIDNAMEASQGEEEPYIDLTIRQEKTFLVIKIINQYSRDFSENLKTTKKKQKFHGIGIRSEKALLQNMKESFRLIKRAPRWLSKY